MTEPRPSPAAAGAVEISLDEVAPDPNQPRAAISAEELADLAESLRAHRLIQPIVVTPHPEAAARSRTPYMILVGERRWRAAALAGLATIPAVVRREEMPPADRLLAQIAENDERAGLGLLERALAYRRAHRLSGASLRAFAARCGKSTALLSQLLHLAAAEGPLREALEEGLLNHLRAARLFERLAPETQEALLAEARRRGRPITLCRLEAAALGSRPAASPPPPPAPPNAPPNPPPDAPVAASGPPVRQRTPVAALPARPSGCAGAPGPETIAVPLTYPMLRENLRRLGAKALPTPDAAASQLIKLLQVLAAS